jgi:hypothetical protein
VSGKSVLAFPNQTPRTQEVIDDCNTHNGKNGWLAPGLVQCRFAVVQEVLCQFVGACGVILGGKSDFSTTKLTIQTSHSTVSQYSSLSYGKEILWSLSYFSQRYSCMLAPSKTRLGLLGVWSTRAGMRPLARGSGLVSGMYLTLLCLRTGEGSRK